MSGTTSALNPRLRDKSGIIHRRRELPISAYVEGVLSGDRVMLSRAITLIESSLPAHREKALELIDACLPHRVSSFRVGITGPPGVGKSTFVEALGQLVGSQGHRLAVLAVDPSSMISQGSILGDKTRMERLSAAEYAYIRPSPAGLTLGGVAGMTRETIILCEAAGYDLIWVETVGVGQSELAVHNMVDFFLLLLLPGAGDELQGIKRGIVEMADLLVVNKADGDAAEAAMRACGAYRNAIHLFPAKENGWIPEVRTCSAVTGAGISDIWEQMEKFRAYTREHGTFDDRRRRQDLSWLEDSVQAALQAHFNQHPGVRAMRPDLETLILSGHLSPALAAERLLRAYRGEA
jgi:LAO/AO transport system kinase